MIYYYGLSYPAVYTVVESSSTFTSFNINDANHQYQVSVIIIQ